MGGTRWRLSCNPMQIQRRRFGPSAPPIQLILPLQHICPQLHHPVPAALLLGAAVGPTLTGTNAVVALTEDHKPNQERERKRIEAEGGVVIWAGTWRVGGVLAVSRAFGDRPLKRYVIACPDVRHDNLDSGEESIILASDGLWDVVSNKVCPPSRPALQLPGRAAKPAGPGESVPTQGCVPCHAMGIRPDDSGPSSRNHLHHAASLPAAPRSRFSYRAQQPPATSSLNGAACASWVRCCM